MMRELDHIQYAPQGYGVIRPMFFAVAGNADDDGVGAAFLAGAEEDGVSV